jgi:hypothetical protein
MKQAAAGFPFRPLHFKASGEGKAKLAAESRGPGEQVCYTLAGSWLKVSLPPSLYIIV